VHRDISNRKKAEEELLFKSTLLQAQSETSIDGILVVDGEGKSISSNKNFGRMWNIPQQILDTRDDEKMLQYVLGQLKNPSQFLEKVRYLYTHKNEKSRDEILFRDGRVFDRYSSPLLDSNDEYYGRVWYFRDITERKKAEERYRMLFEGAAEGILVAESETRRFKYANPAICRMLGYKKEELTRMSVRDIHPEDNLDHVISEFEAQAKGEKTLAPNIPCLRKDGTIMYADVNTAFMVIDGRQCNVGFFTDITERKKTGEALQRAHDELENRVQERTAELGKAVEELESEICERKTAQKQLRNLAFELAEAEDKLRHRIATNVHDQISQNLALSKIKLESLKALMSLPECVASLDEICGLVTQTIESSRSLTSELSPPVLYELGFEAAVEWLVRQTRQLGRVEAEFTSDGRPKPLNDLVSRVLFRAVQGLLVNVAKHAQARKVIVSTRRKGNEVQVTVEDDGVGFDASKVISYEHETGGFGLFSIRERLGYIGGRVDIDSKPGHGTRVTLSAHIDQERKNDRRKRK
jgi:PAS domain S-box-containing protein